MVQGARAELEKETATVKDAWNQLQTCPPNLTPTQAATIVTGFSTAFACTSNAPEPKSSGSC